MPTTALSTVDRLISAISPKWGLQRVRARTAMQAYRSAYDAGGNSRRTLGWTRGTHGPDAAGKAGLTFLRERSRHSVRNTGLARKAINVLVTNHIGKGIIPAPRVESRDEKRRIANLWHEWADATGVDVQQRVNFYGLQAQVDRCVIESGEALVRKVVTRSASLPVPLRLQVLEPDYLDESKDTFGPDENGKIVIQGIEFDKNGTRTGYWLFKQHPQRTEARNFESVLVPADQIIHVYHPDRAGQVRGVPWLSSVLLALRDWSDYCDAQLLRQKIAACFVGFVFGEEGAPSNSSTPETEDFEPGTIRKMQDGSSMEFSNPPEVEGIKDYAEIMLRELAAGANVTYEQLTGDYSRVNFTSGRMGRMEFDRSCQQWQSLYFIPQFCVGVWNWWVDAAIGAGVLQDRVSARWTPPSRDFIDPNKEATANRMQVRDGQKTPSQCLRERGVPDPERHFEEYAEDVALIDQFGLIFDSDPRKDAARNKETADAV